MVQTANDILIAVKNFADRAHGDQVRKFTGERYIGHPVRVMELVLEFNNDIAVLAAALLHDVLEDTAVTPQELLSFLSTVLPEQEAERSLAIVKELTDVYIKRDYPSLNRSARKTRETERLVTVSADAQTIKYADIIDNVTDIATQETDFAHVYIQEARAMVTGMDKGDVRMRERAFHAIEQSLARLRDHARS